MTLPSNRMIDIAQYRQHIGLFRQKMLSNKFLFKQEYFESFNCSSTYLKENLFSGVKSMFKIILLTVLLGPQLCPVLPPSPPPSYASCPSTDAWCSLSGCALPWSLSCGSAAGSNWCDWSVGGLGAGVMIHTRRETGNF